MATSPLVSAASAAATGGVGSLVISGVSALGKVLGIGPKATKENGLQRTLAAPDGSALQLTLLSQCWGHVLQGRAGTIPDGGFYVQVWNTLRAQTGRPGLQKAMDSISGERTVVTLDPMANDGGSVPTIPGDDVLSSAPGQGRTLGGVNVWWIVGGVVLFFLVMRALK